MDRVSNGAVEGWDLAWYKMPVNKKIEKKIQKAFLIISIMFKVIKNLAILLCAIEF